MASTILFKTTEISIGIFRIYDKFKLQAKITVYTSSIKLALFGLITLIAPCLEMFVYAAVLTQFINMLMKFFYAKSLLKEHNIKILQILNEKLNVPLLKELKIFSFIMYNNFDVSVRMVSRQLDTILLGKLYSVEIVGIYKIVKEIANLIAKLTDPVYQAIYPEFAKLLAYGKKREVRQLAIRITIYLGGAGLAFYGLFAIFGESAIDIVFGSEFLGAYKVVLVYLLALILAVTTLTLYPIQHAFGLAKRAFSNQFQTTIVYVPILIVLTYYFDMIGASLAYIFYYIYITSLTFKSVKMVFN